jgi:hypothetical protein
MPKQPKSPQEKKRNSLAKDRRNDYVENSKASRKAIPRLKAVGNRRYRKALKRTLSDDPTEFGVPESAAAAKVRKNAKRKDPDIPLGEHIKRLKKSREWRSNQRSRSKK